jgi:hypothetical protein
MLREFLLTIRARQEAAFILAQVQLDAPDPVNVVSEKAFQTTVTSGMGMMNFPPLSPHALLHQNFLGEVPSSKACNPALLHGADGRMGRCNLGEPAPLVSAAIRDEIQQVRSKSKVQQRAAFGGGTVGGDRFAFALELLNTADERILQRQNSSRNPS